MNSNSKAIRDYVKYFSATALISLGTFGSLGYFLEPISGDLTRVGKLSERDFGWNKPQPEIQILQADRASKPDVIVLGDSFSASNTWQTVAMQKSGLKVLTFNWLSLGHPSCIEEWLESASRIYPSASTVIVETIERSFFERFNVGKAVCKRVSAVPSTILVKPTDITRAQGAREIMPDPIYALKAFISTFKRFDQSTLRGKATVAPLNRADLFSNRRSDLLLYYSDDDDKRNWTENATANSVIFLSALNASAKRHNMRLLIAVIPNKLTVYSRYLKVPKQGNSAANVWNEMRNQGIPQIDLFDLFAPKVASIPDFYLSNDTHLSTSGYIFMGESISAILSERR
jgi:hypothetical protein